MKKILTFALLISIAFVVGCEEPKQEPTTQAKQEPTEQEIFKQILDGIKAEKLVFVGEQNNFAFRFADKNPYLFSKNSKKQLKINSEKIDEYGILFEGQDAGKNFTIRIKENEFIFVSGENHQNNNFNIKGKIVKL